jgi:hypothetical protein
MPKHRLRSVVLNREKLPSQSSFTFLGNPPHPVSRRRVLVAFSTPLSTAPLSGCRRSSHRVTRSPKRVHITRVATSVPAHLCCEQQRASITSRLSPAAPKRCTSICSLRLAPQLIEIRSASRNQQQLSIPAPDKPLRANSSRPNPATQFPDA